jgi:hypothetical protein
MEARGKNRSERGYRGPAGLFDGQDTDPGSSGAKLLDCHTIVFARDMNESCSIASR